jgi:hypothetical protein
MKRLPYFWGGLFFVLGEQSVNRNPDITNNLLIISVCNFQTKLRTCSGLRPPLKINHLQKYGYRFQRGIQGDLETTFNLDFELLPDF